MQLLTSQRRSVSQMEPASLTRSIITFPSLFYGFLFKNIIIATSFALSMQLDNVFFYIMVSDVLTKCASLSNFRKPYIISASCVRFCLRFIKKDLRLGM
ncbi:hypothetical protein CHR63_26225 [Serratia marcescens]|nr:hypothetical protein CHR63_26225 [Serratia marcescens]